MNFHYVLPRWEGSATDARVLQNALLGEDPLIVPQGNRCSVICLQNFAQLFFFFFVTRFSFSFPSTRKVLLNRCGLRKSTWFFSSISWGKIPSE